MARRSAATSSPFATTATPAPSSSSASIGLPGDRIRIDRGQRLVNGALDEPYVRSPTTAAFGEIVVPPARVYVLGDNRANSEDSRFFGPVSDDRLIGRAVAGIWPPRQCSATL